MRFAVEIGVVLFPPFLRPACSFLLQFGFQFFDLREYRGQPLPFVARQAQTPQIGQRELRRPEPSSLSTYY